MSSKLFAFQVAKPLESLLADTTSAQYNPVTQTLLWEGGTRAQAVYCTLKYWDAGRPYCNAYGDYCTTWGPIEGVGAYPNYHCD